MDGAAGIHARRRDDLGRVVQIGVAGGKLLAVSFPAEADPAATPDHPLLDRLERYLDGERDDFADVDVALTLPTARRRVLESLRAVGHGETVDVARLASMTPGLDPDEPEALDVVRAALASNPVPVVVPDHRVVDGRSTAPAEVVEHLRSLERR